MSRTAIYAYGFDGSQAVIEAAVVAIGLTPFTIVILPTLHVDAGGNLFLNSTPLERLSRGLAPELAELKTGFSHTKKVLLSIGPDQSDFDNIAADLPGVVKKIARFAEKNGIDGIDLDYGGAEDADHAALLASIAERYAALAPGAIITAAPYHGQEFWAGKDGVLSRTATGKGNLISWFNVQFYQGTVNQPPAGYLDLFSAWATAIGEKGNGVAKPAEFIVPGCNATVPNFTPADMAIGLGNIRNKYTEIGGGFVWNHVGLNAPVKEWGKAISKAVAHQ